MTSFSKGPEVAKSVADTQKLCAEDPLQEAVRARLVDLERQAHTTGWDGPDSRPRIFQLDAHSEKPIVDHSWLADFNYMLRHMCDNLFDGNVGLAMQGIARHVEEVTYFARTGQTPPSWDGIDEGALSSVRASPAMADMQTAAQRGLDLHPAARRGFKLHGFGVRAEGWAAADGSEKARRAAAERKLDKYPNRREMRFVMFVARDGRLWNVMRTRGELPAVIQTPLESKRFEGNVVQGLFRLLNSGLADPAPSSLADPRENKP